jgi:broad specificity phosphatase PhoE
VATQRGYPHALGAAPAGGPPLATVLVVTRMLLVRHGQSEWNAVGRWQGQADPPLSPLGRRQARQAADLIGAVDVIVASDLERASRTAAIISEALGVGPIVLEPRFRERSAGEWSGLTKTEIDEAWPGYLAEHRRPPGFEPDDQLLARTTEALEEVHREYAGAEVLVVTHGGVVYTLEADAGLPFERLPNLGSRWLEHRKGRFELGDRLLLIDEAADAPPGPAAVATQNAYADQEARALRAAQDADAETFSYDEERI